MTKSYENKLKECQIIWAKEKYTVLSKSQKIYLEIREYLKGDVVDFDYLISLLIWVHRHCSATDFSIFHLSTLSFHRCSFC